MAYVLRIHGVYTSEDMAYIWRTCSIYMIRGWNERPPRAASLPPPGLLRDGGRHATYSIRLSRDLSPWADQGERVACSMQHSPVPPACGLGWAELELELGCQIVTFLIRIVSWKAQSEPGAWSCSPIRPEQPPP